eukprot:scaffold2909_cov78-Cylindrotheca_fusiformis.AAC.3
MWGKKKEAWYSPNAYLPSYKKRQRMIKMARATMAKNLEFASRNLPYVAAILLGMVCLVLAKRVAQKLHLARLRWQYKSSTSSSRPSTSRSSSFADRLGLTPKKPKRRSKRRYSHLKYCQQYQKEEEDKIIPYSDVISVFARNKTPPRNSQIHHNKKKKKHSDEVPEDKENCANGQSSSRGDGRPVLREMR